MTMRMRMPTLGVAGLGLALALAACAEEDTGVTAGGGDPALRQEYVEAIAAADDDEDNPLDDDELECYAEAMVDAIGVDDLEAAVTPAEIAESDSFDPVGAGVDVTDEDAVVAVDGMSECVDLRELFLEGLERDQGMSPEQIDCVAEAVDEDVLKEFLAAALMAGEDEPDPEAMAALNDAVLPCIGG